jgi:hypothetical protein
VDHCCNLSTHIGADSILFYREKIDNKKGKPFDFPFCRMILIGPGSILSIMFISAKLAACCVLHMMQSCTFSIGNGSVGLRNVLRSAYTSLVMSCVRGFPACKFTGNSTLLNTLTLILLTLVNAGGLGICGDYETKSKEG